MTISRRSLLLGTTALAAGTLASCGTNVDVIATVAQLIQKIQAGVAQACAAIGKWVPTVETVIAVISGLLGTALTQFNLADAVKFVQAAIEAIAAQCPQPAPTPPSQLKASVGGKDVPIVWY